MAPQPPEIWFTPGCSREAVLGVSGACAPGEHGDDAGEQNRVSRSCHGSYAVTIPSHWFVRKPPDTFVCPSLGQRMKCRGPLREDAPTR